MTDKNKNVSLLLLLGVLFFALPLHADELTKAQSKEISALWDEAQRLVGEEDYQAALKITEQALDKLEQWRVDEFPLLIWTDLQVQILMQDQQYRAASKKQKELLSLTKDLLGDKAPKTLKARALLSDLDKIAALTPEQQKEISKGEAAYHAAVAEGDLEKAITLGEQMAAKEKKYLGEECTWYANSLSLLAENYIAAEKYKQAEAKYLEGLKIIEKLYGQMHLTTAIWCDFLATLYSDLGEEEKSQPLRTRIFAIRHPIYGDKLKSLLQKADSLLKSEDKLDQFLSENLKCIELLDFILGKNNSASKTRCKLQASKLVDKAIIQKKMGDREGLLNSLARAVQFANISYDHEEPDASIATTIGLIGTLYREQGEYTRAETLLKQALAILEKAFGPDHPDVALGLNNLASLYDTQGKYAKAEPLYERALAIKEKAFGPDHPGVAVALNNLALLYKREGKNTKAKPLLERALAIKEKAFGPDHPDVALGLNNLASLYSDQGKYAEAEPLYERSLAIAEKALGPDHPDVATSINNLASLYNTQGKYAKVESLYKRALAIREKAFGPDHPDVALGLNNLASLYSDQGKYAEAEPLYERSLAIAEKALGPDHPDVATSINNLASLYNTQGKYAKVESLYKRALAIREKAFGPDHLDVALGLNNLASLYSNQGKYEEAEPLYERSLAIAEKILGPDHPNVATSINNLASLYNTQGKYAKAEPLYERALEIYEKALGPDHPGVALVLNNLGLLYSNQGKYEEAEPLYERALAIKEKAFGPDHPDVAIGLNNLGLLYSTQGKYVEAEPLYERALAIAEKILGTDHPGVAVGLNNLGMLYYTQGKYAKAEPLYERALAIKEKAFGPDHPDVAIGLNNLGLLYSTQGKYAKAEPLYERALEIYEKALGLDHPGVALGLNNLGLLYGKQGKYAKAKPLLVRALAISEKALGTDHFGVAVGLNNLGLLYYKQGKYAKAEPLYERALAIKEKAFGPDHPDVALGLNNLASLYDTQGKYVEAKPLYERALEIYEKALGLDHPGVALVLNNLASLYNTQGKYAKAEPLIERALAIKEKAFGPDHPGVALGLNNLGRLYSNQGKYEEAEPLIERALAIKEKAFGPDHPDVALGLNNLGLLYSTQGKYAKAEPLYERALAIAEKILGPDHPDVAIGLNNLGSLYHDQGKILEAAIFLKRGIKIGLNNLEANATVQSERQQLVAADNLKFGTGSYINSCLQLKEKYGEAYRILLAVKGAVTRRQQIMRTFADLPELEPLFAKLQSTVSQLSTAYLSKKQIDPALREERIGKLTKQKEVIEQQISRQSESFRQAVREMTTQDLQTSLPPNSVLIDFVEHFINERDKSEQKPTNKIISRLAAFIIRPEGPIELVDLCSREDLQLALFFWKENLGRNTGPATELGKLIWEPLAPYVDDAELVLYSPVGELGSVPFAALPGKEPGSYLLEDKQLVMIPQAKLLPSLLEREQSPKPTVLAIGGVDYESVAENETEEPVQLAASRRAVRWKDEAIFTPLPETETELEAVGKLYNQQFDLGKLQTLKGDRATEAAVKRLAPQYSHLHFATHGFFAPPEVKSALDNSENQFERQLSFDDQPRFTGFNPGLLSGLALAGANDPPEEGEDGIWTAEEVATMNLSNVDLAVLSACETGLGKVAGGEGLLGLQRAFQVSGAGTTVASLWQVDDAATRTLMEEFYRNLWEKKLPKIEALRQAQLKMLREYDPQKGTLRGVGGVRQLEANGQPERLPPSYWAAWVLSGDWR